MWEAKLRIQQRRQAEALDEFNKGWAVQTVMNRLQAYQPKTLADLIRVCERPVDPPYEETPFPGWTGDPVEFAEWLDHYGKGEWAERVRDMVLAAK